MSTRFLIAVDNVSTNCTTGDTSGQWDNINWYQPTYTIPMFTYVPVPVVIIPTIWILPPTVVTIREEKMEDRMFVYEITVVDKKECKILTNQTVVAKDRQSAILELDLTLEIKQKNKKGEIEFIFIEKGAFNKIEKKEVQA